MKILLVVPEYPPNIVGGGGVVYKNLVDQYVKKGNEVTVFVGDYAARKFFGNSTYVKNKSVSFYKFPEFPYPKTGNFITSMPVSFPACVQLFKLIKSSTFDVAHVHGFGHLFVDTVCIYLKIFKIPYVFTFHGCPNPASKLAKILFYLYAKTVGQLTLKNSSSITAVSSFTANNQYNPYAKETKVIGNALDKVISLPKKGSKTSEFLILSVGRVVDMKGFDIVIRQLPKYLKIWKNIKYIIVGPDAGFRGELISLAKSLKVEHLIQFTGKVPRDKVYEYLQASSVVAIPSRWEPFNIFALEAMSCNKVIFTTYGGGLKEVLGNYSKAVNIYTKDIKKAYNSAYKNKSNFNPNAYSWDVVSNKYLKLLENLVNK